MKTFIAIAALLAAAPTFAQASQLSLEQRMLLRCSAAFAMVAHGQENANAAALQYPDLAERGRDFFVRASARVMDEAGLSREALAQVMQAEAQDLWDNDTLDQVMPVCLSLLPPE